MKNNWKNWLGMGVLLVGLVLAALAVWQQASPPASIYRSTLFAQKTSARSWFTDYYAGPAEHIRFAVIGDFGDAGTAAAQVAALIKSWQPDFIVTTGDNNYPDGEASTIDANIGQYYQEFINNYRGQYGPGSATLRFFPVLGNHDLRTENGQPYYAYFTLPGNERYYDFVWGPVQFFMLNANPGSEPDGTNATSTQSQWLQRKLAYSRPPWQIVITHEPPYSSGKHGSSEWMQWPYAEWGADLILSGSDHSYERLERDGITYVVNGAGGRTLYFFREPLAGSQVRYAADYGAMLVEADAQQIQFQFITHTGAVIDASTLQR